MEVSVLTTQRCRREVLLARTEVASSVEASSARGGEDHYYHHRTRFYRVVSGFNIMRCNITLCRNDSYRLFIRLDPYNYVLPRFGLV